MLRALRRACTGSSAHAIAWRARAVHGLERTVVAAVGLGPGCFDLGPCPRLVLAVDVVLHQGEAPRRAAAVVGLGEGAGLRGRAEGRLEERKGEDIDREELHVHKDGHAFYVATRRFDFRCPRQVLALLRHGV